MVQVMYFENDVDRMHEIWQLHSPTSSLKSCRATNAGRLGLLCPVLICEWLTSDVSSLQHSITFLLSNLLSTVKSQSKNRFKHLVTQSMRIVHLSCFGSLRCLADSCVVTICGWRGRQRAAEGRKAQNLLWRFVKRANQRGLQNQ